MTPAEEAAVQAAVRVVRAHRRRDRGHRPSAADVLDERLELDWTRFDAPGFELLRAVLRRANGRAELEGGDPDDHAARGARYEERYSPAGRRLSRAL